MSGQTPFTTMAQVTADLAEIMLAIEDDTVSMAEVHGMIGRIAGYTALQAARDAETPVINRAPSLIRTDTTLGSDGYRLEGGRLDGATVRLSYVYDTPGGLTTAAVNGRYAGTYADAQEAKRDILQRLS